MRAERYFLWRLPFDVFSNRFAHAFENMKRFTCASGLMAVVVVTEHDLDAIYDAGAAEVLFIELHFEFTAARRTELSSCAAIPFI
jgi:hypothetical protein